jgi:hypothetical protein
MSDEEEQTGMLDSIFTGLMKWLDPKAVAFLGLCALVVLLLPETWAGWLGFSGFRRVHRVWFGGAVVGSVVYLFLGGLRAGYRRFLEYREDRQIRQRLHKLTPYEKAVLRGYIVGQTRTQYFGVTDGIVAGLVAEGILFRPGAMGSPDRFPFNIYPWVWDYLNEHPELLRP